MDFKFKKDIILTKRLLLRPMHVGDAGDMFEYTSLKDISKYLSWEPHKKVDETIQFLRDLELKYLKVNSEFSWGIILLEKNKLIGVIKLFDISYVNKRAEISYILNPNFQGNGYVNEAFQNVIEFTFNKMNFIRIQARCTTDNKASENVMLKGNMLFEGLLKKYWIIKGEEKDVILYAITK